MVQKRVSRCAIILFIMLFDVHLSLQLPSGIVDDNFDGSHNNSEVTVNGTMKQVSIKLLEPSSAAEANLFQVKNTNRSKRDVSEWFGRAVDGSCNWVTNSKKGISEWFGRAIDGSSNWVTNSKQGVSEWFGRAIDGSSNMINSAKEKVKSWVILKSFGTEGIKWIGAASNDTSKWIAQTAIDRDVWFFDGKEHMGKWVDYVPIEASKWASATIFHCFHKFILVQVVVEGDGEHAVGGVIKGGPTGAAAKSVEYCVDQILKAGESEKR
ncbi:uncharacterized protein LOC129572228 [Sitodiplosis mosellana]|uniref:uncharacterized protein LOC129572228 n=1 Tax=Sitodiplosis mosellana TaxID=263140 RepID=UPI00244531EC|nr:uncharacterized protein LOC129572228 [Sitodiplosis mosellana]